MSQCPACGHVNIDGLDECEQCLQSLSDLHLAEVPGPVEQGLLSDRVSAIESNPPRVVPPALPVGDVLAILAAEGIGCVLIVEDDRLLGIFSERDALLRLNTDVAELSGHPVSEFMTPTPETLAPTAKIAFALQRMDLGGYRHLPIVDSAGRATGIISVRDVLNYLTMRMRAEP